MYSGFDETQNNKEIPEEFQSFMDYVHNQIDNCFNQCIVNWYPDNKNFIAYHSDCTLGMIENANIAIITITKQDDQHRIFQIKSKKKYRDNAIYKDKIQILLKHGTVILMNANSQIEFVHGIPKFISSADENENDKVMVPRINISFRQFQ